MDARSPGRDTLLRTLSADGRIGVRTLEATALVGEAAARHRTSPVATAALGRALMGAVLLGSLGKDGETVQVRFRGNGPLGAILATADTLGRARGYVRNPGLELPLRGGHLDVAAAVGIGELSVVRHRPGWREPYTGIVPIVSGEIAEDLALYLTESEQTPSAVALGVYLASDGSVAAAGGFLAQALPGATEEDLARLEDNVRCLPGVSQVVRGGGGAPVLLETLLAGLGGRDVERSEPRFHCGCDEDRVVRAVALLGRDELRELCEKREAVEVRCEFCGDEYRVDPERARALVADA